MPASNNSVLPLNRQVAAGVDPSSHMARSALESLRPTLCSRSVCLPLDLSEAANSSCAVRCRLNEALNFGGGRKRRSLTRCVLDRLLKLTDERVAALLLRAAVYLVATYYTALAQFSDQCALQVGDTCSVSAAVTGLDDKGGWLVATVVGDLEWVVGGLEEAVVVPLDGNLVAGHCTVLVGRIVEDAGLVVEGFEDGVIHGGDDVCGHVSVLCVLFLHSSSCYLC